VQDVPFKWGAHDCLTFTNGAWRAMYGAGWADDWQGRYMTTGATGLRPMFRRELQSEFGFKSFSEAMAARLTPVSGVPPRGALVITSDRAGWFIGGALGICTGTNGAFLGSDGIEYATADKFTGAWV
jgi:hypothetical protein